MRLRPTSVRYQTHLSETEMNVNRHRIEVQTITALNALIYLSTAQTSTHTHAQVDRAETRDSTKKENSDNSKTKPFPFHIEWIFSLCGFVNKFSIISCVYLRARSYCEQQAIRILSAHIRWRQLFLHPSPALSTSDTLRSTNFDTGNISFCFIFAFCDAPSHCNLNHLYSVGALTAYA